MPSGFFAFVRFSVRTMIHFEPACVPSVVLHFCSTTSVSLCGFVSISYRRCSAYVPHEPTSHCVFVPHYNGFRRVIFPSSSSLGGNIDASRVVVVFVRPLLFFSLPPFLYLVVLVFATFSLSTGLSYYCLLYTSPSPRDQRGSRMPSSA